MPRRDSIEMNVYDTEEGKPQYHNEMYTSMIYNTLLTQYSSIVTRYYCIVHLCCVLALVLSDKLYTTILHQFFSLSRSAAICP